MLLLGPRGRVVLAQPVVDLSFRLGFVVAIPLLQDTGKFFGLATQSGEIVVSEFAPLLSHLALKFMPLAEQNVFGCIHVNSSLIYLQRVIGRSTISATSDPTGGQEHQNRTQKRDQDAAKTDAAHGIWYPKEPTGQPSTKQSADDTHNDVSPQAETVALHHQSTQPACN
jgi:hypothetical protein